MTDPKKPTVIVADDHPAIRESLIPHLLRVGLEVVGEADDGDSTYSLVVMNHPDLLLFDLEMPGLSGIPLVRAVKKFQPSLKLFLLSAQSDGDYYENMRSNGVDFCLTKITPNAQIAQAALDLCQGKEPTVTITGLKVNASDIRMAAKNLESLNLREKEILYCMCQGVVDKDDIAELLALSPQVVKNYRSAIYVKLQTTDVKIIQDRGKWIFLLAPYELPVRNNFRQQP